MHQLATKQSEKILIKFRFNAIPTKKIPHIMSSGDHPDDTPQKVTQTIKTDTLFHSKTLPKKKKKKNWLQHLKQSKNLEKESQEKA